MAGEDVGKTNQIFPKIAIHTGEDCHVVYHFPREVYRFLLGVSK
jgi:hypothetical protein